jgi:hypothetical protein
LEQKELAVGDSTRLEIIFSTRSYRGRQNKRPSIETNMGPERLRVAIKSEVITNPEETYPITIKPYKFDISQFGEKERKKLKFEITNVSEKDLEINLVDMPNDMFELKLPKKVKAGQTAKGQIELLDEYVDQEFEKSLTIELGDEAKSRFTVPVKRTIRIPGQTATAVGSSKK